MDTQSTIPTRDLECALLQEGFCLINHVGAGGFGEVFKVQDRGQNIRAVKLLTIPKRLHPAVALAYGRQHHEGIIEKEKYGDVFRHPHIVQFHTSGMLSLEGKEIGYTVSEFVDGPTLEAVVLGSGETGRVMKELTSAIAHMHEFGFIHNDIKPDNVKLDTARKRRTVLLDFSNAEEANTQGVAIIGKDKDKEPVLPTTKYRAPELDKGEYPSFRSDVWALGAVFYELFTSRNIKRETEMKHCSLQRLVEINIPQKWRSIIGKCLQEVPEKRYADACKLSSALWYGEHYYGIRIVGIVGLPAAGAAVLFLPLTFGYVVRSLTSYKMHQCIAALEERNNPEEAETSCKSALKWDSTQGTAWLYLGHSLIEQGKNSDAEHAYQKADMHAAEERRDTSGNIKVELYERELLLADQGKENEAAALHDISARLYFEKQKDNKNQ